jgi:hypothetical protein
MPADVNILNSRAASNMKRSTYQLGAQSASYLARAQTWRSGFRAITRAIATLAIARSRRWAAAGRGKKLDDYARALKANTLKSQTTLTLARCRAQRQ